MEKWLEIPKDRKRQPGWLLCLILALTALLLFTFWGRKALALAEAGVIIGGYN